MAGRILTTHGRGVFETEMLAIDGTATGVALTEAKYKSVTNARTMGRPETAEFATITVESNAIRYKLDGSDPLDAADLGQKLSVDDVLILDNYDDIKGFRANEAVGASAGRIHVNYS